MKTRVRLHFSETALCPRFWTPVLVIGVYVPLSDALQCTL